MKRTNINIIIAVFLVLIAVSGRIINQNLGLYNLVPIAAISMFSTAVIKDNRALAFLVPLLGQFLADVYFQYFTYTPGFYWSTDMLFNYGAILSAASIGAFVKQIKPVGIFGYLLGASWAFFLVSNFGYYAHGWNGYTFAGLVKTYVDAVPFYKNSFIADMLGGVLLVSGYFAAQKALINKAQKVKA